MTPVPNGTLLHYRLVEKIGEGGMGEVWKAVDSTLDREVAIKILPDTLAQDASGLERFKREAKLLASLNHPNIASVFSVHEDEGVRFLAMELVPGEDLARALRRGAFPTRRALQVAREVAEALAAAHEHGIIHRDVKPANVQLATDGRVKVLDFGLAKSLKAEPASLDHTSPTVAKGDTQEGTILGTTRYMSPEQARGEAVDRRSDVWSFGCLVYELLTGTPAYAGKTASDTIAAILEREPDWQRLPGDVAPNVRRLLERCLRKDSARRLRDMGDIQVEISDTLEGHSEGRDARAADDRRERLSPWTRWVVATVALAAVVGGGWWLSRGVDRPGLPIRFAIELPPELRLWVSYTSALAVSPDGETLAFVTEAAGQSQLHTRRLDELESVRVAGSDNGDTPFFSPDGRSLGFAANGKYWRVALSGGDPVPISAAPKGSRGAAWLPGDTVAFAEVGAGLDSASVTGGSRTTLSELDGAAGETGHGWPQALPDGRRLLFSIGTTEGSRTAILDLDTGRRQVITGIGDVKGARYLPTRHLVYAQSGRLMALPYDLDRMKTLGPPAKVVDSVFTSPGGVAYFAVSHTGVLAYAPGGVATPSRRFVWVTRDGTVSGLPGGHRGAFEHVKISPGGKTFALMLHKPLADHDIWLHDIETGRRTLLVSEANTVYPTWLDDGKAIAYASTASGPLFDIYRQQTQGSPSPERWLSREGWQRPTSWSAAHRVIAFYEQSAATGEDIYLLTADGQDDPIPFVPGPGDQRLPTFSPDGRWIAYVSNETGAWDVYVAEYPSGRKEAVSIGGGREPIWSRDGKTLFYRAGNKMMEVELDASDEGFSLSDPHLLFEGDFHKDANGNPDYDVAADGRFLMIERGQEERPTELRVIVNWFEELERLAPPSDE